MAFLTAFSVGCTNAVRARSGGLGGATHLGHVACVFAKRFANEGHTGSGGGDRNVRAWVDVTGHARLPSVGHRTRLHVRLRQRVSLVVRRRNDGTDSRIDRPTDQDHTRNVNSVARSLRFTAALKPLNVLSKLCRGSTHIAGANPAPLLTPALAPSSLLGCLLALCCAGACRPALSDVERRTALR